MVGGVNIIVKNSKFGTASDNSGFFRLYENIDLPCTLELSINGYEPKQIEIRKNEREGSA